MRNKTLSYFLLLLLQMSVFFSNAQNNDINHDVVVKKAYSPVIGDAVKINDFPKIVDSSVVKSKYKYAITSVPLHLRFSLQEIKPVKMIGEPLNELYHHYILLGMGNYTKPMFEYRYGTTRSKKLRAGFHFSHLSQHGKLRLEGIEDKVASNYSRNNVGIYLHRIFKRATLQGAVNYNRYTMLYYGRNYTDSLNIIMKDNKQYFSHANASMRYLTTYLDSSHFNYNILMNYNYFEDRFASFHNDISLRGRISKVRYKESLLLDFNIARYNLSLQSVNYANTLITMHPHISKSNSHWGIDAGLNFNIDVHTDSTRYYYYPDISLYYNVIDHFLVPYLGINGHIEDNNYKKIAMENFFISPGLRVRNTNHLFNVFAGFRGNFTENIHYNLKASYSVVDNAYFFVNKDTLGSMFTVDYDNIERYDINAELAWQKSKKLEFTLLAQYHHLKMDKIEHPWHIPDYELSFNTAYNLKNKIIVNLDMFVKGQRYAMNYQTGAVKIPETFDISLGIEYRYTKVLSAFLRVNNLLARKNYLWYNYPTEGFNMMAGIIYSF